MKKLTLILLVLFCGVIHSQDFELTDLTNSTTIDPTDIFLFSTSGGLLYKLTYTNLLNNIDDENMTWLGTHLFEGTTGITDGTFYIQNIKTATTAGELSNTSSHTYLKYKGAQEDTLATWKHTRETFAALGTDNVMSEGMAFEPGTAWDASSTTLNVASYSNVIVIGNQGSGDFTITSITNGIDGQIITLVNGQEQGDYYTIQDNSTINLRGSRDFIFNNQWQSLTLAFTDQNTNEWTEISRSHQTTNDMLNADIDGTLNVAGISTFDNNIILNDELVYEPEELSAAGGSSTLAITQSFVVIDGDGGTPSSVSDFTGLKNEGQRLIVMCLAADPDGVVILDNTNIVIHGGSNAVLSGGDIIEFIYMDGKWYNTSPYANNN